MVVLIATVAIGLYLLLSVLLGGWPGSRFNRERFLLGLNYPACSAQGGSGT